MVRGVDRRPIFFDDSDRRFLFDRIASVLPEEGAACFAWAFMPNHVHLVTRTGHRPIAKVMQRIGTAYGRHFNRRHERSGYVFQGRYKALAVADEAYLLPLVRYVHRNPLEAGIVRSIESLARYPWSGHAVLLGRCTATFQSTREILAWFGSTRAAARARLCAWMRAVPADSPAEPLQHPMQDARQPSPARTGGAAESTRPASPELDPLVERICRAFDANPLALRAGRRTRAETLARAAIVYLAIAELGLAPTLVARSVGVSHQAVGRRVEVGRLLAQDHGLRAAAADP